VMSLALLGRFVSTNLDGTAPTTILPMIVEAVTITLLDLACHAFGKSTQV
jgi:hypothetical protein